MSRMTCLISFSGFSALSTRSLRLARINVETLSSNAITPPNPFRNSCPVVLLSRTDLALKTAVCDRIAATVTGANKQSYRQPDAQPQQPFPEHQRNNHSEH